MEITQEKVVALLIEGNGKVKNSDLLGWFKGCFDSSDPVEKKQNRELFKGIVNNLAVVKEIDDVKYVVLKTKYHHLLTESQHPNPLGKSEKDQSRQPGERTPGRRETAEKQKDEVGGDGSHSSVPHQPLTSPPVHHAESEENKRSYRESADSVIELALKRTNFSDLKLKKTFQCEIAPGSNANVPNNRKSYGLPLRVPPTDTKPELHRLKCPPDDPSAEAAPPAPESTQGRPAHTPQRPGSPLLGHGVKVTKPPQEEPARDPRFSSAVPLEPAEHEWLVKSAAGHWGQVYGLLLQDHQLLDKRDFMSGFTALHWAAKWGNSDMLAKMVRISRESGADVDLNARTHGGYTPLHIAALHDQEFVLCMLVDFGADPALRDNGGKRPYHYLHGGITGRARVLLEVPGAVTRRPPQDPGPQEDREDADLFQDLSKGLHTISRLFQPHATGTHRKRHKHRPEIWSLSEEPCREESD